MSHPLFRVPIWKVIIRPVRTISRKLRVFAISCSIPIGLLDCGWRGLFLRFCASKLDDAPAWGLAASPGVPDLSTPRPPRDSRSDGSSVWLRASPPKRPKQQRLDLHGRGAVEPRGGSTAVLRAISAGNQRKRLPIICRHRAIDAEEGASDEQRVRASCATCVWHERQWQATFQEY